MLSDATDEPELQVPTGAVLLSLLDQRNHPALAGDSPGLFVDTVDVPQHAGVVHDHDERPHTLAFDPQLLQAVSLQLQVVVGQLLNQKPGST